MKNLIGLFIRDLSPQREVFFGILRLIVFYFVIWILLFWIQVTTLHKKHVFRNIKPNIYKSEPSK